jgi:hypothetical protein
VALPFLNPALAYLFIGPLYLLLCYVVLPTAPGPTEAGGGSDPLRPLWAIWQSARFDNAGPSLGAAFKDLLAALTWPHVFGLAALLVFGTVQFARACSVVPERFARVHGWVTTALGGLHGVLHVMLAILSVWLLAAVRNVDALPKGALFYVDLAFVVAVVAAVMRFGRKHISDVAQCTIVVLQVLLVVLVVASRVTYGWIRVLILSEQLVIVGGTFGAFLVGLYLYGANWLGNHANEVMACQSSPRYRNFVRLHIDDRGQLHGRAIGIDKPPSARDWVFRNGRHWLRGKRSVSALAREIDSFEIS